MQPDSEAVATKPTPYRAMREATGLTMNELARRTGISSGRLSIIERGVPPNAWERNILLAELGRLLTSTEERP